MLILGVDENGLGPKLGPLVATGCAIEFANYRPLYWQKQARALGVDDSKKTSAFGKMAFAESIALALAERVTKKIPKNAGQLFEYCGLLPISQFQLLCPDQIHQDQCWKINLPLPFFKGSLDEGRAVLDTLEKLGCQFRYLKSNLRCPQQINMALSKGMNKFQLDLRMFEELFLACQQESQQSIQAICGMVGGIRKYRNYFSLFEPDGVTPLKEQKGQYTYQVVASSKYTSTISFETSADATHFPVAMASMVGKYFRELWMEKLGQFYQSHGVINSKVSGYHDPKTKKFIQASQRTRKRLGISDPCFLRVR